METAFDFVACEVELEDAGGFGVGLVEFGDDDFLGQAEFFHDPDAVVVDIELVPGEAVAGADGVGVVVVVPSFAAGEQGDPPGVARVIFSFEAARTEEVGSGVDQPGGVQAEGDAEECSPENHGDCSVNDVAGGREGSAEDKLRDASDGEWKPVVLGEPDVALIAGKVGGVAAEESCFRVKGATGDDPTCVRPPCAVARSVRVAIVVGVLMMDSVSGNPEDGAAFEGHGSARGDEVLEPLGNTISAVGEQAVVGHADADIDGKEVHDGEYGEVLPGEAEERGDGADVEERHDDGGDPVDASLLVFASHAQVLLDLAGDFGGATECGTALWEGGRGDGQGCGGSLRKGLGGGGFGREQGWRHRFFVGLGCLRTDFRLKASRACFMVYVRVL